MSRSAERVKDPGPRSVGIRIRIRIDFIAIRTEGFYVAHKRLYNKQ